MNHFIGLDKFNSSNQLKVSILTYDALVELLFRAQNIRGAADCGWWRDGPTLDSKMVPTRLWWLWHDQHRWEPVLLTC